MPTGLKVFRLGSCTSFTHDFYLSRNNADKMAINYVDLVSAMAALTVHIQELCGNICPQILLDQATGTHLKNGMFTSVGINMQG